MNVDTATQLRNEIGEFVHDCRNRIGSLKLTLHMLERQESSQNQDIIDNLREQITDLTQLVERVSNAPTRQ